MYKITEELNVQVLLGRTVEQISYATNLISIYLDNHVSIQIMGSFSISDGNKIYSHQELYPIRNDFNLLILLDNKIEQVNVADTQDELTIFFEKGITLTLFSDINFESFEITSDSDRIII